MKTHEELLAIANCKNNYCHDCNVKMSCNSEKEMISELANELLDIREKITKSWILRFVLKQYRLEKLF